MSPEYVSGAGGMSSAVSDDPLLTTDSNSAPERGLAGTMLAQEWCPSGDCAVPNNTPNGNPGGLLADLIGFFISLFGGSGNQSPFLPGQHRHPHYPAIYFITDPQAQMEEFTPNNDKDSSSIEGRFILAQADPDDTDADPEIKGGVGEEPMGVWLGKAYWRWRLSDTLARIARSEKLPFRNDGSIFQNREGKLPPEPSGYYKEYVHPTPGVSGPGAQRIVTGAGGEIYYTPDHYESFLQLR